MPAEPRPVSAESLTRDLRELIAGWKMAGVTDLPHVPAPQFAESRDSPESADAADATTSSAQTTQEDLTDTAALPAPSPDPKESMSLKQKREELAALAAQVAQCTRCQELAETRTQTVFGVGHPNAKIMFIGEAPGADEDAQGEPFVGRAGKLMNKIIDACGITREEIYICNILRCRPPQNRNPLPKEAANCREHLDGQIAIVRPKYIVCWGSIAAKNLLDSELTIGKLRGEFHRYGKAKVLCTYHPSYLLRNPSAKKDVWEDMQFLFKDMGIVLTAD